MSILNSIDFFPKLFHDQRWTIAEPSLSRDGCHGITITIDVRSGTVMITDELQWSLNSGRKISFFFKPSGNRTFAWQLLNSLSVYVFLRCFSNFSRVHFRKKTTRRPATTSIFSVHQFCLKCLLKAWRRFFVKKYSFFINFLNFFKSFFLIFCKKAHN